MAKCHPNVISRTMVAAQGLGLPTADLASVASFAKTYQRWLNRLDASSQAGDLHGSENAASRAAVSFAARVCGFVSEVGPKSSGHWTIDLIKAGASEIQPHLSIPESVQLSLQMKSNGGYRPVLTFGRKRSIAQRICSDVVRSLYPLQPFDFLAKGRGQAAALVRLCHLIEEENSQYVVVVDIKDCFGSPNKEQLSKLLRLSSRVVNNSILIGDEVTITPHPSVKEISTISITDFVKENGAARRGLPQGSSASPMVMYRAVLGPLLATLSFVDRLILYGDDIAVPAKDLETAKAYLKALKSIFSTSPVGPLAIGRQEITHLAQGADYLGYRICRKPKLFGGHIHLRPSPRSYARFEMRALDVYLNAEKNDAGAQEVQAYVNRWIGAFNLWVPNEKSKELIGLSLSAMGIPGPPVNATGQSS
jgi:hypothetical protein